MFSPEPIGYIHSPYTDTKAIPKGAGAKHDVDGTLEILPAFEPGLKDIDGFSHLFVIWEFHKTRGPLLTATPPFDGREHGVFATRSPQRPTRSA